MDYTIKWCIFCPRFITLYLEGGSYENRLQSFRSADCPPAQRAAPDPRQLSEKAEISNNYLSNIENGRSIPSLETLVRLCEAMEVTPDTVLMGTVTDGKQYMNDDIQQLLAQCTPQEKRYVIGILKVFLAERSRP